MTNDGKCLLRWKRKQKRCFSQAENKDGTRKTESSAFKGEKHLLNLCFYRRLFTILKVKRISGHSKNGQIIRYGRGLLSV